MALPAYLPYGFVSIYGVGTPVGTLGMTPPPGYLFGVIYQIAQHEIEWATVGNNVLFNNSDVVCRLAYANSPYTLIEEAKLVLREEPLP